MEELDAVLLMEELREVFASGKTKEAKWRIEQLNGIVRFMKEREGDISEALRQDLNKPTFESFIAEISMVAESAGSAAKSVKKWMAPKKVSTTLATSPAKAEIIPEPLGVALVISAWNYPIVLSLDPVIGAIAAGNVVVLKPSEVSPASSAVLAKFLPLYVDSTAIRVVEGGVSETTSLLEQRWDKIFYTGSTRVGRIVMAAAAKHLTPVTLELGGKSPSLIDATADIEIAARRISWGKWASNNGQTCISPDYVIAEESIVPKLLKRFQSTIQEFYGEDPSASPYLSRVVNNSHFNRLTGMLNDEGTADKVVHGGQRDEKTLYIAPTVILDPPLDSPVMSEEIFGPLLVVITVKNMGEAIKLVNSRPKPLALYLFTQDKQVVQQVVQNTSSGAITVNDTMMHFTVPGLPFGGVGESGIGSYHGKHSFDVFSHLKPVLYRKMKPDLSVRYPPYSAKNQGILRSLLTGDLVGLFFALLGFRRKV